MQHGLLKHIRKSVSLQRMVSQLMLLSLDSFCSDKPFIISETGAGGIVGMHSNNQSRWSEEYQVTVDELDAGTAMGDPNIAGLALWQFCDIKVDQSNTSTNRPGGINNKGVVSQWRQPKPAAAAVGSAYERVAKNAMPSA
eukprot:COSAG02_NODE_1041_length_15034_cov_96.398326_11_plen_140_part_00